MIEPVTRYARHGGAHIAYQLRGGGERDLLVLPADYAPCDSFEDEPHLSSYLQRLGTLGRVICFDRLGIGLSDPWPENPPSFESWVDQIISVLDAVGSSSVDVIAHNEASMAALLLAARYPARLSSLVLLNGTARVARADDYPVGVPQRNFDTVASTVDPEIGAERFDLLAATAPSMAGNARFRAWWERSGSRGASPSTALAQMRATFNGDVRSVLPSVQARTLVVHRRDNEFIRVGHSRYLAEHLADVKYVELAGADNLPYVGDADELLGEVQEFLTGVRSGAAPTRLLTVLLFTDIVGSTQQAAAAGDQRWARQLDDHDFEVRHQLERFGGHEVNTTGDGFLARFDRPAVALECAAAIQTAMSALGTQIRLGVHAGEVEVRGNDIGGLAVHVAARVCASAVAGEVLVTSTVKELVAGSGLRFVARGAHTLRGVPDEWHLFALEPPEPPVAP